MLDDTRDYLDTLVNGQGIYRHETHYFMGCLRFSADLPVADQVLGSGLLTPDEARRVKLGRALIGHLLWDNDLTPFQPEARVNYGPANMASMVLGTRYKYTAWLAGHPLLVEHLPTVREAAMALVERTVHPDGASSASAHYDGASMVPVLDLLQVLQTGGTWDGFADMPRLARHAEWDMQLLSPPEPRFGGRRKIVAIGDGSTEDAPRHGQLGTAFDPSNPSLSRRLLGAWHEQDRPYNAFHGSGLLKIDDDLPFESPRLGNACFPGYMAVLRDGWGTERETAAWLVGGDWYSDHRHNDNGTTIIYALGAPLAIDYGSLYAPRVAGSMMHFTLTPEFHLSSPWDADLTPLDAGPYRGGMPYWTQSNNDCPTLESPDPLTSIARASFAWKPSETPLLWQRSIALHRAWTPASAPILIVDRLSGERAHETPVISTLPLMAVGPVETPSGTIAPAERLYDSTRAERQELPSAGPAVTLAPGWNRFGFTGQWLIDWDIHVFTSAPAAFSLGNWGHAWHPAREQNQFRQANGRPFEESQHLLRIRTTGSIVYLIVPWRKDAAAHRPSVTIDGRRLRLEAAGVSREFDPDREAATFSAE